MNPLQAFSAVAGLFGSGISAFQSNKNTKNTNATNLQIAKETNATSERIAHENNLLQQFMNRENNDFNRNAAIEMFNLENAYNTPEAQKQRLLEAGLNPATMYENGASTGLSDGSTPSAASSGISPSMPSLVAPRMDTPPSVLGSMFQALEVLSRVESNKSNAKLSSSQTKQIDLLMNETLKQAIEETKSKEINNAIQNLNLELNKLYSASERDANLHKTMQEYSKMIEEVLSLQFQQKNTQADTLLKKANSLLTANNNKKLEAEMPFLIKQAEETANLIREQQKTQKAIQANEYASAESHRQNAELTKEQRFQLRLARSENFAITQAIREGKQLDVKQAKATYQANVQKAVNAGLLSVEEVRVAREMADKYAKDNESYWLRVFTGVMDDALDDAMKAAAIIK